MLLTLFKLLLLQWRILFKDLCHVHFVLIDLWLNSSSLLSCLNVAVVYHVKSRLLPFLRQCRSHFIITLQTCVSSSLKVCLQHRLMIRCSLENWTVTFENSACSFFNSLKLLKLFFISSPDPLSKKTCLASYQISLARLLEKVLESSILQIFLANIRI